MQRLASSLMLLSALLLGGLLKAAPVRADNVKVIEIPVKPNKAGQGKAAIAGGPNDDAARWWNDPKIVKGVSLTDEQRTKMGELLEAYRENLLPVRRLEAYHEALVQGDWDAARKEAEAVAKNASTSVHTRGELKIDVLSLLNAEQLKLLVDKHPRLIYQPWTRAMRGNAPR